MEPCWGQFCEGARPTCPARREALTDCSVLVLERHQFERLLGSLNQLQQLHYVNDPRRPPGGRQRQSLRARMRAGQNIRWGRNRTDAQRRFVVHLGGQL